MNDAELVITVARLEEALQERIDEGESLISESVATPEALKALQGRYSTWDEYNRTLLRRSFTTTSVEEEYAASAPRVYFGRQTFGEELKELMEEIGGSIRRLRSIGDQLPLYSTAEAEAGSASLSKGAADQIFIVHGRENATKQLVARFVRQVSDQEPIILHEQANSGRTTIEKFEESIGDVGFAIILLTGDDEGWLRGSADAKLRARQNVVLELGFFMGVLGRSRVAILYEADVELPSDISGMLYTSLDGGWQMELARELRSAGFSIDLNKALI